MERLFSYGTLQQAGVQQDLFGRKLTGQRDWLVGYVLGEVTITDAEVIRKSGKTIHPILQHTNNPEDKIAGTVFEVSLEELTQADSYEVAAYARTKATFISGIEAWIYADAREVN